MANMLGTLFVTSADGTRIAFDRLGEGPPLILVSGLLCTRRTMTALAHRLAQQFTVINYDRRGRGDSSDTVPYAVEREVEDLGALIAAAGGAASIYGHSSGAGLALRAAAAGLPITRLVLHEPPYGPDDGASKESARQLAVQVEAALADGRLSEAIGLFFEASGLPPETAMALGQDPARVAVASTMAYDFAVMGDVSRGGTIPEPLVRAITVPTLILAGGNSPLFFQDTATAIAELLVNGQLKVLDGQDHGAPADAVAPVVAAFVAAGHSQEARQ